MAKQSDIKGLLEYLVKSMVKNPGQVDIVMTEKEGAVIIEMKVAPEDRGLVIGKQGKTIKALRKILSAASSGSDRRITLEIQE
jgi:predicted RNA-binding protein YlqC (UPF0109 family)